MTAVKSKAVIDGLYIKKYLIIAEELSFNNIIVLYLVSTVQGNFRLGSFAATASVA